MKRLDRYLLREMVVPFLIGQFAVAFMLTGTVLYNNADTFLNYHIPALGIVKIASYFLPYLVSLTMPVAMAVATSLTVSRLARDSEITAMRAAGVSLKRIFLPVVAAGFLISIGDFYFAERVVPWSNQKYEETMSDLSRELRFLIPQEKQVVQSADKKYTAYVGRMETIPNSTKARLYDVMFMLSEAPGAISRGNQMPVVILADTALYDNGIWTLYDAKQHQYTKHGLGELFQRSKYIKINYKIAEKTFNLIYLNLPLYSATATTSFKELTQRISIGRKTGYVNPRDLLDWHFKLSVPFSCLVFAIACPPLSLRFARAGSFMGVLLSIILVFVYWNTLLAAKILGTQFIDKIPPYLAAWGQNVIFAAIGAYLLWRSE